MRHTTFGTPTNKTYTAALQGDARFQPNTTDTCATQEDDLHVPLAAVSKVERRMNRASNLSKLDAVFLPRDVGIVKTKRPVPQIRAIR